MRIVFWQNILSIHQSVFIRNLAEFVSVTLIVEKELSERRIQSGWAIPDFGNAELIVAPSENVVEKYCCKRDLNIVHVFSGIDAYPMVSRAFHRLVTSGARIGLISEAYDGDSFKGKLRFAKSRWHAFLYSSKLEFILAIGKIGEKWFLRAGFPLEKIYPWGYFVEAADNLGSLEIDNNKGSDDFINMIYIGACIRRKRIDLLLNSLSGLLNNKWTLCIIGDGPERENLETLSRVLGLDNKISFLGVIPNLRAMEILIKKDFLILPSRFDGWGAVINEALCRGIPVVCSDSCGAAGLVSSRIYGRVFASGSVESLQKCLFEQILTGSLSENRILALQRQVNTSINGQAAAEYFLKIVYVVGTNSPKPKVPWEKVSSE